MKIEDFSLHTHEEELEKGIEIFKQRNLRLKAVRNDCYHFVEVDQREVKIIMDEDNVLYAHCGCNDHENGYCPHEVACFLYILKQNHQDFAIEDYQEVDFQDDIISEGYFNVLKDYQEMVDNGEFDLAEFLKYKKKDELLLIIGMFDAINPELGVFVFQLFYEEIMKYKKES